MQKHGFHPTEIIFSSTTACNLHCEHCFINRTPHKLEIADAVRLIESCVEAGGQPEPDGTLLPVIDRIGFSGGEPFLYMDFLIEVTKAAISHDLMFDQIMTNGDWWQNEADLAATLQKLYDAGYDGKIGLSWDSYHGQTTDRMETFIRTVQEIFGEDSINIQTVEEENKGEESLPLARTSLLTTPSARDTPTTPPTIANSYLSSSAISGRRQRTAIVYAVSPETFFAVLSIPKEISVFTISGLLVLAA